MPTTRTRFRQLLSSDELRAESLMKLAQGDVNERWSLYQYMAAQPYGDGHPSQ